MVKKFRRAKAKFLAKVRRNISDPALDFLGASQLGLFSGRVVLNSSIALSSIAVGAYSAAIAISAVLLFDAFIQLHTLAALNKLMGYEVWNEILANSLKVVD